MQYKICVVTGTRAEYGLLRNLLFRLRDNNKIDLRLVVTGTHLSDRFGNTQEEIIADGFSEYESIQIPIDDDSKSGMAYTTGIAIIKFSEYFRLNIPDMLVVLGDRFEIYAASTAAFLTGIPIAHIAGGDVTEGAVDDTIRHCLTKMAILHFPGCELAAKRIVQMGENPDDVHNVGEPGLENCLNMKLLDRKELSESIGFDISESDFSIVTFHPVTMEDNTGCEQIMELIKAMDQFSNMKYIITMANADAGGRTINDIWISEMKKRSNWFVTTSLGTLRYLSAIKNAKMVIGNSSSGLIEAPPLGTPTINIGNRQKGRMIAESVFCCSPNEKEITKAINEAMKYNNKKIVSPFGNGTTSEQIEEYLIKFLENKNNNNMKHFYDIEF